MDLQYRSWAQQVIVRLSCLSYLEPEAGCWGSLDKNVWFCDGFNWPVEQVSSEKRHTSPYIMVVVLVYENFDSVGLISDASIDDY